MIKPTMARGRQSGHLPERQGAYLFRLMAVCVIFTLPCTSAFALHAWVPLNMGAMLALAACIIVFSPLSLRLTWDREDIFLIVAVLLGFLGLVYAPDYGSRTINHSLAIISCVGIYYFFAKSNIYNRLSWTAIVDAIALATVASALFVIAEFLLSNFAGISVNQYVPYMEMRLHASDMGDSTMLGIWIRPRGFAIEAGHMATFFELGLPLTAISFRKATPLFRTALLGVSIAGFLLLASAAATSALMISSFIVMSRLGVAARVRWTIASIFLLVIITLLSSERARTYADDLIFSKTMGFMGLSKDENWSAFDRNQRARIALSLGADFPLGFGWGTGAHLGSTGAGLLQHVPFGFISLYAEVLVAGGWLGLLCFVVFLVLRIRRAATCRTLDSEMLLIGMCSLSIHYITLSNYWFPTFWAAFGLISVFQAKMRLSRHQLMPGRQVAPGNSKARVLRS